MSSSSVTYATGSTVSRRFHWPEIQLNVWLLIVLSGSTICLGLFSWFMTVQIQMEQGIPWVFPFMVATAGLSILFVFFILFLAFRRSLIPDVIILLSFILFVLWLTALIGTSIQLYGSISNVNSNCQNYVINMEFKGPSINTLAWITQMTICNGWRAVFSFTLVITVFYVWMLSMAFQVRKAGFYD